MFILDVNVLIYAFSTSSPEHRLYRTWLVSALSTSEVRAPSVVVSGFLRIATNPKLFPNANTAAALSFIDGLETQTNFAVLHSSAQQWQIFKNLCQTMQPTGNDFSDLFIAAFALEYHATLVSADNGFTRFKNLLWLKPT
ncbi:MAG: hypothetical protein RLZZ156_70 [Deinococcota bacterium]|jgi:uncharacterized protein